MSKKPVDGTPLYVRDVSKKLDACIRGAIKAHAELDSKLLQPIKPLFTELLYKIRDNHDESKHSIIIDKSHLKQLDDGTNIVGVTSLTKKAIIKQVLAVNEGSVQPLGYEPVGSIEEFVETISSISTLINCIGTLLQQVGTEQDRPTVYG